jgi:hypothetical protein
MCPYGMIAGEVNFYVGDNAGPARNFDGYATRYRRLRDST